MVARVGCASLGSILPVSDLMSRTRYETCDIAGADAVLCERAPLERLARYAGDIEYRMMLNEGRVKRSLEEGSKEPLIAGRHITHDPTITMYR